MTESTRTRLGLALPSLNTPTATEERKKAMSDSKDPAIKLFGRTIPLPLTCEEAAAGFHGEGGGEENKELPSKEASPECEDKDNESSNSEEEGEPPASATMSDGQKSSLSADQERTHSKDSKAEAQQQSEKSNPQDKQPPKKPNKILPCPRCNSLDTKFCYYNNYNVNQPRHLCKNCQRYWTAGGTMRNVPVGAGRRKNKSSSSQYRHLTISDATLQSLQSKIPDSIHHSLLKPNGTVLSFSSDTPPYESMTNVLSLAEKSINNCHRTGFHQVEQKRIAPFSCRVEENGDEHFTASSAMAPKHTKPQAGANLEGQGFVPQMLCVDGSTWPYPWSLGPAFCASSCAMPIFPATAYWGCAVPSTWSIPWLSPRAPSPNGSSSCSLPNSPSLGKHSREGDILKNGTQGKEGASKQSSQERCIWIPKTLRIDDPEEAAKCSIWATIGTKNDKTDAMNGGGLFKTFHKKQQLKNNTAEASQVLHANPAALSRSINFQESS